jgi:hypothetical protein
VSCVRVTDLVEGGCIDTALVAIDTALEATWHRELFTRSEAASLLLDVRAAAAEAGDAALLVTIDATIATFDGEFVDHRRIANALLDLRIAIAS